MTDKNEARARALLDAVRRLERTFETSATVAPSTTMLYLGSPFLEGDLAADARAWLAAAEIALRNVNTAERLLHFLRIFTAGPTDTMALTCMEAACEILHGPFGAEMKRDELEIVRDAYARCAFFGWMLGSPQAAMNVAQHAASMIRRIEVELFRVRCMQTLLAALRTAEDSYLWPKFDAARERNRALNLLAELGELAPDVRLAQRAYLAEQVLADREVLEQAKGKFAGTRISDLDDREGIVQLDEFETRPSLIVVGSLDHLPDRRNDRGAPRSEFGHLAQRAMPLVRTPDLTEASASLKSEFPWLSSATDRILETLVGREAVLLPPVLLHGKPGCGKSEYARRLTDALGLPRTEIPCAGAADGSLGGTSRQWSNGRANAALQACKRTGVANPALVLDELEKADPGRHNGSLLDVVLAMVEPGSRKAFHDPFLECPVDLSAVAFIACVNDVAPIRGPLLDRFIVLECPDPTAAHLDAIVQGILRQVREASGLDPRFTPDLDAMEWSVLRRGWRGGSIRPLKRAVDRLLALRSAPGLAH